MLKLQSILVVFVLAIGLSGCNRDNSSGSPTGPSGSGNNAPAAGTWTGMLIRPGSNAPMSVRWQATVSNGNLEGPLTLTNGSTSVTITARGNTAGNDRSGYSIHMMLTSNSGDVAAFPNCKILGNTSGTGTGDPFPSPYTSITVPSLDVSYFSCEGFMEYPPQRNFQQETVRLTLTK